MILGLNHRLQSIQGLVFFQLNFILFYEEHLSKESGSIKQHWVWYIWGMIHKSEIKSVIDNSVCIKKLQKFDVKFTNRGVVLKLSEMGEKAILKITMVSTL